ncbi:hypothetical protein SAMN05444169_5460 [Bradyrhizobium erythrophlei]|jgi:hypothetical protein|uniref:Uncharacterized protein n=1 Tax=Bradyrhizobium erythrophlei TaxID=1437360 RepID=A0A1M5PT68_9BRAD|nr:hypothetical protein SAMN05444169_5460 [Bradyrhizobium erythrophlei]
MLLSRHSAARDGRRAQTVTTPISRTVRTVDIEIRFWDFMALRPDEKLFPHFGEARAAIFAIQKVENGGHDRTPSLNHDRANVTEHRFKPTSPLRQKWLRR